MYESIAILKKQSIEKDEYLNEITQYTEREVFVSKKFITRNEFYKAATADFKPEIILELTVAEDYEGESVVEFEGKLYSVIRTYQPSGRDTLELLLERKIENE